MSENLMVVLAAIDTGRSAFEHYYGLLLVNDYRMSLGNRILAELEGNETR